MFITLDLDQFSSTQKFISVENPDDNVGVSLSENSLAYISNPDEKLFLDLICHDWHSQILNGQFGPAIKRISEKIKKWLGVYHLIPDKTELFRERVVPQDWIDTYLRLTTQALQQVWNQLEWHEDFYQHAYNTALMVLELNHYEVNKCPGNLNKGDQAVIEDAGSHIGYRWENSVTGRLSTTPHSFPIHRLKKEYRAGIIPQNDVFLELDYNAADLRSAILLCLPDEDFSQEDVYGLVCDWLHMDMSDRQEMKHKIFVQLYAKRVTPLQDLLGAEAYLDSCTTWDDQGFCTILTPYHRILRSNKAYQNKIQAFPLLMQSVTNDAHLESAFKVNNFIYENNLRSKLCFLMHDAFVIDLAEEDLQFADHFIDLMSNTKVGKYQVNVRMGENYGEMRKIDWTESNDNTM